MSFLKRIRDLIIEILIAVILVTALVVYFFMVPKESRPNSAWVALAVNTAIVFGFLISWFRPSWKSAQYWVVLGLLMLCHSAVYIFTLHRVAHFPLIYYVATNSVELVLFSRILSKWSDGRQQPIDS
jgi:uncharacterized membrane protein HdeD (DUF308 family)